MSKFLSLKEVGIILSVTPRTIRSWVLMGKIAGIKIGKEYRISEEEINKLIS
jgi:excisionase family DNA binding protein